MDEITLDDKVYVSSKRAAKITGYAKDYVGQLCREGKVEARLVGRNWYVLETSIREHRFGAPETVKKDESLEIDTDTENGAEEWKVSSYTTDLSPELLPVLKTPEKPTEKVPATYEMPPVELIKPELKPVNASIVTEMQAAWQDWFSRTGELKVSNEILLEDTNSEDHLELLEPGTEPISIQRLENVVEDAENEEILEEDEEIVPINRTYTKQPEVQYQPETQSVPTPSQRVPVPEGRIIKERRIIVSKKKPSRFLQFVLLLIGLVSIGVATVGTGYVDTIYNKYNLNFKAFNYLAGERSIEKQ